ncbi:MULTISPECIES: site-specific integrase [unclassified Bradyrhizobium]|uniref:site-specific integrase n=2 Tax=Bradyrhizobium TaxID=374 RepID=UPI001FF959BF|nr:MULTISPECIES: site-specific integrase [unclassified Bradyrhizobium]MCK1279452.1 tyrosine-type recombinase/integrase [Bradyrhizobium sp. 61]MCK1445853.1 tyrosine-type recombinase/integrase [Bradyrhizobium sp. 48]
MPILKLGRRAVTGLPSVTKATIFYDSELTGFGVKVTPTGAQSWIVEYRPGEGGRRVAKRRMVIGTPATLAPEKARDAAEKLLASVKLGADPATERGAARKAETVDELLDAFTKRHLVEPKLKAGTIRLNSGYIKNHIRPALGRKKATAVTHSDVSRLQNKIGETHPVAANRVVTLIGTIWGFGLMEKILPKGTENPAAGIKPNKEQQRQRYLTVEELERLGNAIREAETTGIPWQPDPTKKVKHAPKPENRLTKIDQHAAAAIRLLLFTGCRLMEVLNLRWAEYDAGRGLLFLPDSKTGRKTVVLSAPAIAILDVLPRVGAYVVASETAGTKDEKPRADLNRPWRAVRKRAGIEDVRIHDMRHSFASVGAGSGLGLPIIGNLLGHTQTSTTQRYAHVAVDPAKRAADLIAAKIADAMNGK